MIHLTTAHLADACLRSGIAMRAGPDNAGGYAAYTLFPANSSVLTVEFKINLLAPAKGESLLAAGHVIRACRTLTVCDLKVFAIESESRTLCASGQQTLMCLHGQSDR